MLSSIKCFDCLQVQNAMNAGFDAVIIYNIDVTTVKKYSLVNSQQFGIDLVSILWYLSIIL